MEMLSNVPRVAYEQPIEVTLIAICAIITGASLLIGWFVAGRQGPGKKKEEDQ